MDLTWEQKPRGHGDKLERKTEAAIVALLAHPTMPEAAKAAGVSETTLWRPRRLKRIINGELVESREISERPLCIQTRSRETIINTSIARSVTGRGEGQPALGRQKLKPKSFDISGQL